MNTDSTNHGILKNLSLLHNHFQDIMHGNLMAKRLMPYAMCYGGHQFGQWAAVNWEMEEQLTRELV